MSNSPSKEIPRITKFNTLDGECSPFKGNEITFPSSDTDKAEVHIITGANGTGKSRFAKLLTLACCPHSGYAYDIKGFSNKLQKNQSIRNNSVNVDIVEKFSEKAKRIFAFMLRKNQG